MKVYICEATKNRFAIVDDTTQARNAVDLDLLKPQIKKIAEQESCDGFIFLQKKSNKESFAYKWNFFNKDGSSAEMCGNAARCVAKILQTTNQISSSTLTSNSIDYQLQMINQDEARVIFPKRFFIQKLNLYLDACIEGYYTNTGVPHYVLNQEPDIHLAKKIRNSLHFPNGTNVTFVFDKENRDTFYACTYERGVEGFTPACGTGAVAAGTYLYYKENLDSSHIKMSGGNLSVQISNNESVLTGDVFIINLLQLSKFGEK
jgi:diaminopimelate epimerase